MDTTPQGVSAPANLEDQFQGLFDAGAFDLAGNEKKPEPAVNAPAPDPTPAADPPAPDPAASKDPATADPATDPASEGEEYESLDDYLAKQKVDPESFRSLPVTVKIDGETKQVPLSEVLKSYQLEGHVQNKSQALAEQQRQFEAERQVAQNLVRQQLQQHQALGNYAQNMLNRDFQSVDWNSLKVQDPAQWSVKMTEFQMRQNEINNYLQGVRQQEDAAAQQAQQNMSQVIQTERAKLLDAVPEWRDTTRFAADSKVMFEAGKKLGFSEAELSQIYDHRIMRVLHLAASQLGLQAAKPEALKKVRAAPSPTSQPGTRNVSDPKVQARAQVMERAKANPRDPDAIAAAFELLAS